MSYILEALKKSEQERERGGVPDIKSIHSSNETAADDRKRSWWPYLLLLVFLINGAIFAVVYLGENDSNTVSQTNDEQQVATLADENALSSKSVAVLKPSPAPSETPPAQQLETPSKPVVEPKPQPKVIFSKELLDMSGDVVVTNEGKTKALQSDDPQLVKAESSLNKESIEEEIQVMLISELPDNIRQNIPNIEFSGHVYSSTAERRSVMLNGRKMREGDAVSANMFLHAITPEGAEFDYQGYRFKLNALQDWSSR